MRRALVVFAATLLAGCLSSGARDADRYFILDAPSGGKSAAPVRVAPMSAASFYDTQAIVYSRAPGTRAYYQFNHWTERPQRAIQAQLAARFPGGAAGGRRVLGLHLEEIYHDAAQPPGTARIAITAELADAATRAVLSRRTFSRSAPAASYDAPGAVQGFRRTLGELLDEIVAWVDQEAAK